MNPTSPKRDPAYPFMVVEILSNVLARADSPSGVAAYLTEEIRELTGARAVLLVHCLGDSGQTRHRVLSVSPDRRRDWAESAVAQGIYEEVHARVGAWLLNADDPAEAAQSLAREGFERSLSVPLTVGDARVGALLALGLPTADHLESEARLLSTLSGVVALVLRNGLLFESQEQAIQERTRELREANLALSESEARYHDLYDNAPDMFLSIDTATHCILQCNHAVEQILGYRKEELLGRSVMDLYHPDSHAAAAAAASAFAKTGAVSDVELAVCRKAGGIVHVSLSASAIRDAEGRIARSRSIWRDISEHKRLEDRLRQAQKLEAIGQLAGGVAHDFNNILAAMTMNLSMLRLNPSLDEETQGFLRDLEADANRAASLTRQLLMFSRRSVLEVRVLDLNDVIANLLKMLGRLIGEDVRLEFHPGGAVPLVDGDAGMLEQVLMNLAVNARDAMPRGGRLTISTGAVSRDRPPAEGDLARLAGRFACLTVADTGCGMDEATRKRIFEPFFTTKGVGQGTGLGLATVHGIAAQHRGWVEVESEPGRGSTFRVFLPETVQSAPGTEGAGAKPEIHGGHEAILVVEDDASVRRGLLQSLRALGYRVFEAGTGQAAVDLWHSRRQEIDLLFTDVIMPEGMTGLELAKRLRAERPDLKVIVSSGYNPERFHPGQPSADGLVYLSKPYELSALSKAIRSTLGHRRSAGGDPTRAY